MKRHWKLITISIVALLLLMGVVWVVHYSNRPAVGNVEPTAAPLNPPANSDTTTVTLDTSYFVLRYPHRYQQQANQGTQSGTLDYHVLVSSATDSVAGSQIGITIRTLPDGGITQASSYQFYQTRPELYEIKTTAINGESIYLATKKSDSMETTALWVHKNNYVTMTMSSQIVSEQLQTEMLQVLNNFQWK